MNSSSQFIILTLLTAAVRSGTVIIFPTIGEIFTERSGIMNLGIEGMMLIGAYFGFITAFFTHNAYIGFLVGTIAGGIVSLIHAYICISLKGNQVISGLALSIFGTGITSFYGNRFANNQLNSTLDIIAIPGLSRIPIIGKAFFTQDIIVYLSFVLVTVMWFILYKTKAGIHLRAVGENVQAANAMGVDVFKTRYFWTFFGGLLAGAGGAYLTVGYSPFWLDGVTAGRGWIAVALVIFSMWDPSIAIIGAYLFGSLDALQFQLQASGTTISPSLLAMLPYALTLVVITVVTLIFRAKHIGVPKELGKPFSKEER